MLLQYFLKNPEPEVKKPLPTKFIIRECSLEFPLPEPPSFDRRKPIFGRNPDLKSFHRSNTAPDRKVGFVDEDPRPPHPDPEDEKKPWERPGDLEWDEWKTFFNQREKCAKFVAEAEYDAIWKTMKDGEKSTTLACLKNSKEEFGENFML